VQIGYVGTELAAGFVLGLSIGAMAKLVEMFRVYGQATGR
jgi:hypothetical protein